MDRKTYNLKPYYKLEVSNEDIYNTYVHDWYVYKVAELYAVSLSWFFDFSQLPVSNFSIYSDHMNVI